MKLNKFVRLFTIVLLILLGIGAIYGGVTLVIDPTGELLGLPLNVLDQSPFENYLIPGIILFLFIGLLSFVIALTTFKESSKYRWLIIFQGLVLGIWLTVEVLMGIFDPFFHYTYYATGVLLVICGIILIKTEKK